MVSGATLFVWTRVDASAAVTDKIASAQGLDKLLKLAAGATVGYATGVALSVLNAAPEKVV